MNAPQFDHVILGFNWLVDRAAATALLVSVEKAIDMGVPTLTIAMSSPGGSPEQAFYVYETLMALSNQIEITTHNLGSVYSAAVPIFMAGSKRFAAPNATFMMHGTTHNTGGSVTIDFVSYGLESIVADDNRAMAIVAQRIGSDLEKVRVWFDGQKLRDTQFALDHGLISEIRSLAMPPRTKYHQVII